jgi:hypothetical protein
MRLAPRTKNQDKGKVAVAAAVAEAVAEKSLSIFKPD